MFIEKFLLAAYISAVALGQHVLQHRADRGRGHWLGTDARLYRNLELLPGNELLELVAHDLLPGVGLGWRDGETEIEIEVWFVDRHRAGSWGERYHKITAPTFPTS